MTPSNARIATPEERQHLRDVRLALLRLHKVLLDGERIRYERVHGRVDGGLPFLHLVTQDPSFGWLRRLSMLVVEFDERLEDEEPLTPADSRHLQDAARALLIPNEGGDEFERHYHRALQESPDVVMAHRGVSRLLTPPG